MSRCNMRDIDFRILNAIKLNKAIEKTFFDLDSPIGRVYLWTGSGNITVNGNTYQGFADIIDFSLSPDEGTVSLDETQVVLSNITNDAAELANSYNLEGRDGNIYVGFLTQDKQLIGDLIHLQSFIVENTTISTNSFGSSSLIVNGLTGIVNLRYPSNDTWSTQDQKENLTRLMNAGTIPSSILYEGDRIPSAIEDTGFDEVEDTVNANPVWPFGEYRGELGSTVESTFITGRHLVDPLDEGGQRNAN